MTTEDRANALRQMKICRFCLTEEEPLINIYVKDVKQTVPLPLQIMACVAIEVFATDGMPQLICSNCLHQTNQAYNFKSTCKKSEDTLKIFLATGNMIKPSNNKVVNVVEEKELKRPRQENVAEESATKKSKVEINSNTEVVTLNYATRSKTVRKPEVVSKSESNTKFDENIDPDIEIIQGNSDEEDEEDYEDEEDDEEEETQPVKLNPISNVTQVTTNVFPCTQCERSFPLQQLLDLHMKNHDRERSFECDKCGRKFFTKYDLGKHQHTHSEDKPFSCLVCKKQFSRESLLHRHEKVHTDVPKYLCTNCDRTYLSKDDLDAHAQTHKKERRYTCVICEKSFVFKQGLQRHIVTHTDEKPHKCNYCEASFTSPIKLMRHITSHAGLRPYPCKICNRTFLLSHHLTRHMRNHYASKSQPVGQHKCDVCSMAFRRKDSLINHSAIHSMVNLKCVICNTAFSTAAEVKVHITTHLAGLPYPCDKCDYSFISQDQLEVHEIKHAEMEYEDQIEREVTMESSKNQEDPEQELEEDEYNEDDIEYTITNSKNADDVVVVRRSKRESKIKNYAQFLKDELGSDVEDELIQHDLEALEDDDDSLSLSEIKPIVRTEGTKVYSRKSKETPEPAKQPPPATNSLLEKLNISKNIVNALPNKQFVDMKIGEKTVRVQKLMMTKAEIEAMAKQGKIEIKGETILLKHQQNIQKRTDASKLIQERIPAKNITIENIIDEQKPSTSQKITVKKTYMKKSPANAEHKNIITEKPTENYIEETSAEKE